MRLHELYWTEGLGLKEVGEVLGVSLTTVWKWMEHHGIERRTQGGAVPLNGKTLYRLYKVERKTLQEVADHFDCSITRVITHMDRHGIERRSRGFSCPTPKTSWPACCDCGQPNGPVNQGARTPSRYNGERFGFDGQLCLTCYNRHYQRWYRKNR